MEELDDLFERSFSPEDVEDRLASEETVDEHRREAFLPRSRDPGLFLQNHSTFGLFDLKVFNQF